MTPSIAPVIIARVGGFDSVDRSRYCWRGSSSNAAHVEMRGVPWPGTIGFALRQYVVGHSRRQNGNRPREFLQRQEMRIRQEVWQEKWQRGTTRTRASRRPPAVLCLRVSSLARVGEKSDRLPIWNLDGGTNQIITFGFCKPTKIMETRIFLKHNA